ncbi:MAG: hypothetical protein ABR924_02930, partial [Terracidiphilus sp.]
GVGGGVKGQDERHRTAPLTPPPTPTPFCALTTANVVIHRMTSLLWCNSTGPNQWLRASHTSTSGKTDEVVDGFFVDHRRTGARRGIEPVRPRGQVIGPFPGWAAATLPDAFEGNKIQVTGNTFMGRGV